MKAGRGKTGPRSAPTSETLSSEGLARELDAVAGELETQHFACVMALKALMEACIQQTRETAFIDWFMRLHVLDPLACQAAVLRSLAIRLAGDLPKVAKP